MIGLIENKQSTTFEKIKKNLLISEILFKTHLPLESDLVPMEDVSIQLLLPAQVNVLVHSLILQYLFKLKNRKSVR